MDKWDGKVPDWELEPTGAEQNETQEPTVEAAPSFAEARVAEIAKEAKIVTPENLEKKTADIEAIRAEIAALSVDKQAQVERAEFQGVLFEKFDEKTGKDVDGNYYTKEMYTADLKQIGMVFDEKRRMIDEKIRSLMDEQKRNRSSVNELKSSVDALFEDRTQTVKEKEASYKKPFHIVSAATRSQGEDRENEFFASLKK